jgi:3'-phosphoadenosine 5'-phosphosulfate sulfotransferase (PAPS reductase)/FAD synthetase
MLITVPKGLDLLTSTIVASVSGGKDSAALSLALTEAGIEHRRVFADTGWEHESTYEHLDYLRGVLGPIDVVRERHGYGFVEMCRAHGMFPARWNIKGKGGSRFCTSDLKVLPILSYIDQFDGEVVNPVGIRANESRSRAAMPAIGENQSTGIVTWRPILDWTERDVVEIHQRHGVSLAPLYRLGARRVGCWPCIFASKADLRLVAKLSPERIALIRDLEVELSEAAKARGSDTRRTMFALRPKGHTYVPASIDEVINWSCQERGNYMLDLDDPGDDWPCASWGFCEVAR